MIVRSPLIQRLEHAGALSDVEQDALQALTPTFRAVEARRNITPIHHTDIVHVIVSGMACRYKILVGGARRIAHYLLPGDLYEVHASAQYPSDWSLAALTPCRVVDIDRERMTEVAEAHQGIAHALWWATLVDISIAREWLANDSRPAPKRQAHLFCELLVRMQAVGLAQENSFKLGLTQPDLADATAISHVHMNRVLQELRRRGLILLEDGRLTIPDVKRLKAFGEFDPTYLHLNNGQSGL
jgi:CRP-like cAMP-binding protein